MSHPRSHPLNPFDFRELLCPMGLKGRPSLEPLVAVGFPSERMVEVLFKDDTAPGGFNTQVAPTAWYERLDVATDTQQASAEHLLKRWKLQAFS